MGFTLGVRPAWQKPEDQQIFRQSKREAMEKPDKKKNKWAVSEEDRVYKLPLHTRYNPQFLPTIQNLTAMGLTESDIGAIVGFAGKNPDDWLNELKRRHPEVKDASAIGKQIADSFLVAEMYKSACGYEYSKKRYKKNKETGEMELVEETIEHQPANAQLAMFIATNRMPEQFKHKIELSKKGFIIDSSNEATSEQIERLAGALMEESRKVKQIEATVIDTEFTETKENAGQ